MKLVLVEQEDMTQAVSVVATSYTLDSFTVNATYSEHCKIDNAKVCIGLTVKTKGHVGQSSRSESITINSSAANNLFDNKAPILLGDQTVTEQGTTVTVIGAGQESTVAD